jgi:hypothetical protein
VNSSTGDDVSKESKLGDTSVLELNVTKTIEALLISVVKKAKRFCWYLISMLCSKWYIMMQYNTQ